jgi:hypothetical protein
MPAKAGHPVLLQVIESLDPGFRRDDAAVLVQGFLGLQRATRCWISKGVRVQYFRMAGPGLAAAVGAWRETGLSAPGALEVDVVRRDRDDESVFTAVIGNRVVPRRTRPGAARQFLQAGIAPWPVSIARPPACKVPP